MEPRIVLLPETKIIGLLTHFISVLEPGQQESNSIPALWRSFLARKREIAATGNADYGICDMPEPDVAYAPGKLSYVAGTAVEDFSHVPVGMVCRTIPCGEFAVFTHRGTLDRLEDTVNAIYNIWLPRSHRQLREAANLEVYEAPRFKAFSNFSEIDLYVPIR